MTRTFRTLAFLAALSLSACGKIKLPSFGKKAPVAPPAPIAAATPLPATTPAPAPIPAEVPKPARAAIDTHAQVVVLCYHRLEGKAGGALSIDPNLFKQQMQEIKDRGLAVISMQDFLAWRRGEKTIPPKSVLITIDDGYLSGYEVGFSVLKEFHYPATYFIYTEFVNKGGKSMTWAQLAEMRDAGMEIGCHTVSHKDLRHVPNRAAGDYDAWLKNEVETSKQILEEKLGIKISTIAYPYGWNNEKVHAAVRAAGYEAAFTVYGQRLGMATNALTLGRYDVTTKDARGHNSYSVGVSFEGMMAPSGEAVLAQDAAASMLTEPQSGATIGDPTPLLKANLATMGDFDAGSVEMRVSGLGKVPAVYDAASQTVSYKIAASQKLKPGPVSVIISARSGARKLETRWNFFIDSKAKSGGSKDGDPLPPRAAKR